MRNQIKPTLGVLALTALLSACNQPTTTATAPAANQTQGTLAKSGALTYVQNELVVGYSDQASLNAAAQKLGGQVVATIPEIRTALIRVPGDALKVAYRAQAVAGIRSAMPNAVSATLAPSTKGGMSSAGVSQLAITNDQKFDELPQYALDPRHLNAQAAWDAGLTGKGIIVGVIDDPGDVTHPDLAPNWAGKAYDPVADMVYTDADKWVEHSADKDIDHGTFVASSIVAAKNGKGVVGVAYDAKFLPVQIFTPSGGVSEFAVARGVVWATNNGAKVLNNSWGGGNSLVTVVKDAFDYAMSQGVTVVASAGNTYRDQFQYPAGIPGVIASVALDASNRKVTFSTSGRHVSTGAPGQDTMLANPSWRWGDGDTDRYQLISGTSFSGPYTAGVAALILQKCPAATPYQVRRVMELNADGSIGSNPNGYDHDTGYGRLDAGKIAANLDCAKLPAKGANVQVTVKFIDLSGMHPGYLADVMLRGQGLKPGDTTDPTPWYLSQAKEDGEAHFSEIAPGTYDVYVSGSDLSATGGAPEDRGTYIGTIVATSGSTYMNPDRKLVAITAKSPNLNPVDPYEPNDTPEQAALIKYGDTTKMAYIFGQPQDADFFKFEGKAGDKIVATIKAMGQIGGLLDSYMFLYDTDGKTVLEENDDRGTPRIDSDSEIAYTLKADGTYYLKVSSCPISCNPKAPEDDNSPFNKYTLTLKKSE